MRVFLSGLILVFALCAFATKSWGPNELVDATEEAFEKVKTEKDAAAYEAIVGIELNLTEMKNAAKGSVNYLDGNEKKSLDVEITEFSDEKRKYLLEEEKPWGPAELLRATEAAFETVKEKKGEASYKGIVGFKLDRTSQKVAARATVTYEVAGEKLTLKLFCHVHHHDHDHDHESDHEEADHIDCH